MVILLQPFQMAPNRRLRLDGLLGDVLDQRGKLADPFSEAALGLMTRKLVP